MKVNCFSDALASLALIIGTETGDSNFFTFNSIHGNDTSGQSDYPDLTKKMKTFF